MTDAVRLRGEEMKDLILHIVYAVLLYGGLTIAQRLLRGVTVVSQMSVSLNLLFLLFSVRVFLEDYLTHLHSYVVEGVEAGLLAAVTYIALRLLDMGLLDLLPRWRKKRAVPIVVRDILRWLVFAVAVFFLLHTLFPNLNLNFLAFSSIVVGYILGNATQDTLGNLIAGVALNADPPFAIGEWVNIGGHVGKVVDMTWRATRLWTKANDYISIPNSLIAKEQIVNYSRPTTVHALDFVVGI